MRVHAVQFDIIWENPPANHVTVRSLTSDVPAGGLIILPEMFATGFSFDPQRTAGSPNFIHALARERQCYVLAGLVSADGLRNEAVACDPSGREITRYCKLHPFRPGGEPYRPGSEPVTFPCGEFTVAPFICYDLRFPEVFRAVAATLFVVIANWPAQREDHWLTLLKARAIENQAYVVGVNRIGRDPKNEYAGRSQMIGPRGDIIADAGNEARVLTGEIGLEPLLTYRCEFPVLRDRQASTM